MRIIFYYLDVLKIANLRQKILKVNQTFCVYLFVPDPPSQNSSGIDSPVIYNYFDNLFIEFSALSIKSS
jgi:hypothetical protein